MIWRTRVPTKRRTCSNQYASSCCRLEALDAALAQVALQAAGDPAALLDFVLSELQVHWCSM